MTHTDPPAYPCPLEALSPRCQPLWSLTKGKSCLLLQSSPTLPNCLCNLPRMANGQDAPPLLRRGEPRKSQIWGLGQDEDWVGGTGIRPWTPQPARQARPPHGDARGGRGQAGLEEQGCALDPRCSCWGVCDGPGPPPAHPLPTLCCYLGTCYGQGQLLGRAQRVPGQAVDLGQLVPGRRGTVPRELLEVLQLSDKSRALGAQLWLLTDPLLHPLWGPALDFQSHQDFLGPGTPANQGREAVGCRDRRPD